MSGNPKLLVWFTAATAVIVGAIVVLATGKWWTLLIPVAVYAVGTTLVTRGVFGALEQGDKPDPVTQAHMEDDRPATR
jgi:membrane protein implicated in regulation of membrane protease activity